MNLPATAAERRTPAEIDRAALSRASSLGVEVTLRPDLRFPPDGPSYVAGYTPQIRVTAPGAIPALIAELEQLTAPAADERIETWLALLEAGCARRSNDAASAEVTLELYTRTLSRFPADVVLHACSTWRSRPPHGQAGGPNWFPTLAELVEACERMAAQRQALIAALRAWRPPTASDLLLEEADRLQALAAREDELALSRRRSDAAVAAIHFEKARQARRQARALRIQARTAATGAI